MREMLLLLLQIKATRASHASWLSIRIPVNDGARRAKLASVCDHCAYNAETGVDSEKY